jgi:hypothetical protein
MAASLEERVLLIRILKAVMSVVEVACLVDYVASDGETNTFFFLLVRFVITDYFAVRDLSVMWDVFQIDGEKCVGPWNVLNSLEEASAFVAKTSSPKQL